MNTRPQGRHAIELRAQVRARDGDDCCHCHQLIDFTLSPGTKWGPSLEHVIPLADEGTSELGNLRLAHTVHNGEANARWLRRGTLPERQQ